MKVLLSACLVVLLLLPVASPPARGDDEEKDEQLVTRLFNVGALTRGRSDFIRAMGPDVGPDDVSDEQNPLFGSEYEEPLYPVGQVDELIELVRMHVRPDTWESTLGAGLWTHGESTLIVRTFSDIVDEVAAFLAALERRHMQRVAVEIVTLRVPAAEARAALREGSALLLDDERFEALRRGPGVGPSVSLLAYERHRAAIFSGVQRTYVQDYDVEVAEESSISDPIVGVANLGLSADVSAILGPDGRSVLIELSAALSREHGMETFDTGPDRLVELPTQDLVTVATKVEIPTGAWALLEGQGGDGAEAQGLFAVRAVALPPAGLGDGPRVVRLDSPTARPARRLELRSYDVAMLSQSVGSRLAESINLVPSNFTPPEPPELAEPMPIFPAESIVELIRDSIVPPSWELPGASIEARNGILYVRNSPDVLRAIEERLQLLRREFVWTLVSTSEVVEVSDALGRALEAAPGRALGAEERRRLDAALESGEARRLDTARVTTMNGARNAVNAGRRFRYLGDYEVEIAKGAAIANPIIFRCISGTGLDVDSVLTTGGEAVQTTLRFVRSRVHEPLRRVLTPHGEIHVPAMDLLRVQVAFEAPLGHTIVVASAGRGGRRQLVLLTATLRRASE